MTNRAFSEVKRLCYARLDGPVLLREVIKCLQRVVPFEVYCASTVDPASGLITHAVAAEMWGEKEAAIFLDHLYFEYDMDQFNRMAKVAQWRCSPSPPAASSSAPRATGS